MRKSGREVSKKLTISSIISPPFDAKWLIITYLCHCDFENDFEIVKQMVE